jgi:hypothetical protein
LRIAAGIGNSLAGPIVEPALPCLRRSLAACALAAAPALAFGQSAPLNPDGNVRLAFGGGGSYLSSTMATRLQANIGGEAAFATTDTRWRLGGKAHWSRIGGETTAENVAVQLTGESQHRWRGSTWFRQKLSLFPALRPGDSVRGVLDTGLAIAMSPLCSVNLGVTHRYDSNAPRPDMTIVTAIALKLR